MSLDESWDAYRARLHEVYGVPEALLTEDWLALQTARVEREALRSGELRRGGPGDWFRSIRWSPAAWTALHGTEGPRGRG